MGNVRPRSAKYTARIDRRRLGAIAVLLFDTFFLAALLAPVKAHQAEILHIPISWSAPLPSNLRFDTGEDDSASNRSFYPYSVIPGGARTAIELRKAVANDSIVRAHYADFAVANTRVERLDKAEAFYVSYRIGNAIFWTKNPLTIAAGELVLTDGVALARTRCGNRLSVAPAVPVSNIEPSPEALETPAGGVLLASIATPFELPIVPPLATMIAPMPSPAPSGPEFPSPLSPFFPILAGGAPLPPGTPVSPIAPPASGPTPPDTPPVATPEPSAALLLAAGLGCLLFLMKLKDLRNLIPKT
jgi:hypothetical protein